MLGITLSSDAAVIRQVLAGRRERFGVLVKRHMSAVYAVAYSQLRNHADAEDVVQEAFLAAFRSLDTLRETRKFEGWVVTIARNLAYKLKRVQQRETEAAAKQAVSSLADAPDLSGQELKELLRRQIAALDENEREILLLHYFAGKNTREISALLDITQDAVKKRLQRARERLSRQLLAVLEDAVQPRRPLGDQAKGIAAIAIGLDVSWKAASPVAGILGLASGSSLLTWALSALVLATAGAGGWKWVRSERDNSYAKRSVETSRTASARYTAASGNASSRARPEATPRAAQSASPDAGASSTDQQSGGRSSKPHLTPRSRQDIEKVLQSPVGIEFENIHLAEVLEFVQRSWDVNIALDDRALAALNGKQSEPAPPPQSAYVTDGMVPYINIKDVTMSEGLTALLRPLGLSFVADKGYIWVSSPDQIAADGLPRLLEPEEQAHMEDVLQTPIHSEFENIHLSEIIEFISDSWDVNITLDHRVIGPKTESAEPTAPTPRPSAPASSGIIPYINLKDVSMHAAFDVLLRPLNLTYSVEEGFLWISSPDAIAQESFAPPDLRTASPALAESLRETVNCELDSGSLCGRLAELGDREGVSVFMDSAISRTGMPAISALNLKEEPLYLALDVLLRRSDLAYRVDGDRILVGATNQVHAPGFLGRNFVPVAATADTK